MKSILEMALEALEYHREQTRAIPKSDAAIAALKEAITQQEKDSRADYCGSCGQWTGGPVICCHESESNPKPLITKAEAKALREAIKNEKTCAELLSEQGYEYNRQTNALIKRHAEQMEAIKNLGEPVAAVDAIYAAWHGAGVDIAGGDWNRFVGMLPPLYTSAPTIPEGWQQATHANAPKYGERVIVLTTDADGDPIPEFAHYNGELGFLGIGGKRIKPVSYWMPSPTAPKGEQP